MRRIPTLIAILGLILSTIPSQTTTAQAAPSPENNSGAVLCSPDVYLQSPGDCVPLGPSQYLTDMARLGMALPLRPLSVSHPDPSLGDLPYHYFKVNNTGTAFYPSIEVAREAARAKKGTNPGAIQTLAPGAFFYLVYTQRIDTEKGTYYLMPSGTYMPGDGTMVSISAPMPGVEINATPRTAFGWVFNPTAVRREPSEVYFNKPIDQLPAYSIVQVFARENIEGTDWLLIGPDEWVLGRDVAVVTPNTTPPAGVTNGRWIDVDLEEQTLAVYDGGQMVYATIVATGMEPLFTRPGLFPIYKKLELETMQGERGTSNFYYLENVPWTMYFDKARALHGAYWRARLGYPQSHGCVNLFPGDAHWLFNWAKQGDWVYVHDPSGQTPTDPNFYGDGGA